MSVGLGVSELLILVALAGAPVNDAASLIEPAGYLKAHGVELKAERLAELIGRDARGGKEQMTQLLAIRWLGAHPAEARKAEGVLETLRAVAGGMKGRDPHGFARDHAARALARIEGKPIPTVATVPAGSVRSEALAWFPAEATLFGAADLRPADGSSSLDPDAVSALLGRLLPEDAWKPVYEFVDAVGNLRLDRVAFAGEHNEKAPEAMRFWDRFTGAGDLKALEAYLASTLPEREERKGPGGEPIIIRTKKGRSEVFVFIGETDFVAGGYDRNKGNAVEVADALLATRAGKGKSVVNGPFADELKKVGDRARGLLVGDIPEELRTTWLRGLRGAPIEAVPGRVFVELTGGKALSARVRGTMKDEEEATAAAKGLEQLRDQGIQALKDRPADVPADLAEIGRKALEGAKVEVRGTTVTATAEVPTEAIKMVLKAVEDMVQTRSRRPRG